MSYPLVTVQRKALDDIIELSARATEIMRGQNSHDPLVAALDGALAEIRYELAVPVG